MMEEFSPRLPERCHGREAHESPFRENDGKEDINLNPQSFDAYVGRRSTNNHVQAKGNCEFAGIIPQPYKFPKRIHRTAKMRRQKIIN
ncbi:hypothetical protein CDL15_Pgr001165 [Punica granatum]|uniref:Uncharacterized protein n=1 Tax=Punica granatum TaxID=22663 RepID=A0A218WLC7_PUNGR|nr:hypothetical protein CDL15_Pgr001165 [Punica granatum]